MSLQAAAASSQCKRPTGGAASKASSGQQMQAASGWSGNGRAKQQQWLRANACTCATGVQCVRLHSQNERMRKKPISRIWDLKVLKCGSLIVGLMSDRMLNLKMPVFGFLSLGLMSP